MTMSALGRLAALSLLSLVVWAGAAPVSALDCWGRVHTVRIQKNGTVEVRFEGRSAYSNICNLRDTSYYGVVSKEVCQQWVSMVMAAYLAGRQIRLLEVKNNDGTGNTSAASCNENYLIPLMVALHD